MVPLAFTSEILLMWSGVSECIAALSRNLFQTLPETQVSCSYCSLTKATECEPQNATFSCPICPGYTRTFIVPSRHLLPHFAGSEVGVASAQIMSALMPASVDGPSLRPLLTRSTSLPPQMYSTRSSNTRPRRLFQMNSLAHVD